MRTLLAGLPGVWDIGGWIRAVFSRDPHPVLQFIRYGFAGVAALTVDVIFFALSEWFLFPVGQAAEADVLALPLRWSEMGPWMSDLGSNDRVQNYLKCNVLAFLTSNGVAYILNFRWVFQSGRHSRQMEIALFFAVSFFAFLVGTALAGMMVGSFGMNEYVAKSGNIVAAILINYVCRKFLIFQG